MDSPIPDPPSKSGAKPARAPVEKMKKRTEAGNMTVMRMRISVNQEQFR
jgi:hypothetical protein